MSSATWDKYPLTLEALAKGLGTNLSDGTCMCSKCICQGPTEIDKLNLRIEEMARWLVDTPEVFKKLQNEDRDKVKDILREKARTASALCNYAQAGNVGKLNAELNHLECDEEVKGKVVTELVTIASQRGKLEAVKCLTTDWGADLSRECIGGGSPLAFAAGAGRYHVVKYILNAAPECVNATCEDSFTSLMFATFWSRLRVMGLLLEKGARISAKDKYGRTALSYAALYGNVAAVNCLCEAGAEVYHEDRDGKTPMELARSFNRCPHIIDALGHWQKTADMRQKLSVRKRLEESESRKSIELEIQRRQKAADKNMEDLLKEIEEEEIRKSQRKEKRNRRKKKSCGGKAESDEAAKEAGQKLPPEGSSHNLEESRDTEGELVGKEIRGKGGGQSGPSAKAFVEGGVKKIAEKGSQSCGSGSDGTRVGETDDVGQLREYWGKILEDSAKCTDMRKQFEYLQLIPRVMRQCQALGVSVKYGKKVLARLERVEPVRNKIIAAMSVMPVDINAIQEALSDGKGLKDMMEPSLWSRAEELVTEHEQLSSQLNFSQQKLAGFDLDKDVHYPSPAPPPPPLQPPVLPIPGQPSPFDPSSYISISNFGFMAPDRNDQANVYGESTGDAWTSGNSSLNDMDEGLEKDMECMVCMAAQKSACCIPCGHISMCYACANEVNAKTGVCPICRAEIEFVMKIQ